MTSQSNSKGKERAVDVLEVEDEEERQERIHELFTKLNSSSMATPDPRAFDFGDRSTFAVEPPLELLSRIQAFLPELAASNADLLRRARQDPSSVDIESVGAEEGRYIEMNLGVGVFDHHGSLPPGIPIADVDINLEQDDTRMDDSSSDSDASSSSSSDSSDSGSDSGSDTDAHSGSEVDIVLSPSASASAQTTVTTRPIKPLPRRRPVAKPEIVVLSETSHSEA
ncbi:hypothetical protein C8Q74DRAFT_1283401 [Fomes fomentarius]|nr:hypothetical protein C8Q74DRAFT_1283401 [Fomes fomentarius]